jgi:hypothetical protein
VGGGGGAEQPPGGLGAPEYLGALLGDRGTALGGRGKPLLVMGRPLDARGRDKRTAERQASVSKALMYSCWARRMICSRVWPR